MKLSFILIFALFSLVSQAEARHSASNLYSNCSRSLTAEGKVVSEKITFVMGIDDSALMLVALYENSGHCAGLPQQVESRLIAIYESSGDQEVEIINGQDLKSGLFYRIVMAPSNVSIHSGSTLPVRIDASTAIYLKRAD
jgi:hypothetical protein